MSIDGRIKVRENNLVRLNAERDSLFTHKTTNQYVYDMIVNRVSELDKEIAVVKEEINQLKRETPTPEGYKVKAVKVLEDLVGCDRLEAGCVFEAEEVNPNKIRVYTGYYIPLQGGRTEPVTHLINRDNPKVELLFGHE